LHKLPHKTDQAYLSFQLFGLRAAPAFHAQQSRCATFSFEQFFTFDQVFEMGKKNANTKTCINQPPPDNGPACHCDLCGQTSTEYDRALLKRDPPVQIYVRWARFKKNDKTGARDVRDGRACWGCNETCRHDFGGITLTKASEICNESAELNVVFQDKRDENVVNDYLQGCGVLSGHNKHTKIDWSVFIKKGEKNYVDKYKEGTWYTIKEFCTLYGCTEKRIDKQRAFIEETGNKIHQDGDEEGVLVLDDAPGKRVRIGKEHATLKDKQVQAASAEEGRKHFDEISSSMRPQPSSLCTHSDTLKNLAEAGDDLAEPSNLTCQGVWSGLFNTPS